MKVAVRKLQIEDVAKLQMLVAENIDAIEPGLVVLDSRLLLGHATIDVIGLDTNGALVLIAVGLTANEEMLLKAVEAYSWCREYPQSLERLYPTCVISDERPPRLVFVGERMPDAFQRKIKQLGFPEVDCVEFRLLDVEGAPAVYFESILRLRRPVAAPAPRTETPSEVPAGAENVIALNGPVAARATSLKLQKLLNQAVESAPRVSERPLAPPREPAAIVSIVSRQAAASAPHAERPRPEPVTLPVVEAAITPAPVVDAAPAFVPQPEPLLVPGPVIVTPEPVIATPEPVVVAPAPIIVTPEPIVLPKAAAEPDAELTAQMHRLLASLGGVETTPEPVLPTEAELELVVDPVSAPVAEPVLGIEPKLELAAEPEPIAAAEPVLALEPKLELAVEPEPIAAAAPVLALEPKLELAVEPEPIAEPEIAKPVAEPIAAPSKPEIPALNGTSTKVPSLGEERISLRSLPELSLRPSAPVAVPRPAPIPAPVVAAPATAPAPAAESQDPRVSFKDLAAALLGPAPAQAAPVAPAKPAPAAAKPIAKTPAPGPKLEKLAAQAAAETPADAVVEPVSQALADTMAELEPALTVESLIKSTPAPAPQVSAAPAPEKPKPAAAALPLEFEGLKFPNDGVLTRQWMEFLSQMSTTK